MLTQASAAILCEHCESQPATIECYTCLMYFCAGCHSTLMIIGSSFHRYVTDFRDQPVYVNMSPFSKYKLHGFEHWRSVTGASNTTYWLTADKMKLQSSIILDSVSSLIPELVNIINEYIASKATVKLTLDCLDYNQEWFVGKIALIRDDAALIQFYRCNDRWNEWVHFKSKRLAPLHSYTDFVRDLNE